VTRVLIVDDHAVVRAGLRYLVDAEQDLETVGQAGSVAEALAQAGSVAPDVILLDVVMPEQTGIAGIPELLAAFTGVRILMLSMEANPGYVRQALAAGASGYVLKEAVDTEVVRAIREVAGGARYLQPELGARLADTGPRRSVGTSPLSEREREVLQLIALGHTNPEIANRLVISVRTAETHRANIMQKLNLTSRADLVRYALSERLLEAPP
jgi:DNA-binding NarL/FixJ family response regulator